MLPQMLSPLAPIENLKELSRGRRIYMFYFYFRMIQGTNSVSHTKHEALGDLEPGKGFCLRFYPPAAAVENMKELFRGTGKVIEPPSLALARVWLAEKQELVLGERHKQRQVLKHHSDSGKQGKNNVGGNSFKLPVSAATTGTVILQQFEVTREAHSLVF